MRATDSCLDSHLRFAPLVRVSSERQEARGESLRLQRTSIENDVARLNGTVVTWGYCGQESATVDQERRMLSALLRDATKGTFDAVIVSDPSRWSRDNRASKDGLDVFRQHGVRFFVGSRELDLHAPGDRLLLGMSVEFAEFHALEQARKSLLSRIAKARRIGAPMGGRADHRPYGRIWHWDDQHRQSGHWEVDEEAKSKIRMAVDRYLSGENIGTLADTLGIAYRSGRHGYSRLYRVFRNHLGDTWNQRFRSERLNIDETVPTRIPPLIDDSSTIARVHARLAHRRTWHTPRRTYMLSRLVRCIVCGGTYSAQTPHPENNLTYYVHLHKSRSRCDAARSSAARIRADKIERAVLAELFHLFQHAPARELAVQQGAPAKDKRDALTAELAVIQRELDTVNRERENFVEAMKALGPAAVTDGFRNELMKMAHRESSLGAQLQALNDEIAHTPSGLQLAEREQAVARELERVRLELFRDPCHFEDLTADEKQRLVNWAFPDPWEDMRPKAGVYVWRERDLWRYRLVVHLETKWPMPPTDRTRTLPLSDEVVADLIGATHCDAGRLGSSPAVVRTTVPLTITGQIVH